MTQRRLAATPVTLTPNEHHILLPLIAEEDWIRLGREETTFWIFNIKHYANLAMAILDRAPSARNRRGVVVGQMEHGAATVLEERIDIHLRGDAPAEVRNPMSRHQDVRYVVRVFRFNAGYGCEQQEYPPDNNQKSHESATVAKLLAPLASGRPERELDLQALTLPIPLDHLSDDALTDLTLALSLLMGRARGVSGGRWRGLQLHAMEWRRVLSTVPCDAHNVLLVLRKSGHAP